MNNNTERKLTDLSGMQKAVSDILEQAWSRGRKYGIAESVGNTDEVRSQGEWEGWKFYSCGKLLRWRADVIEQKCSKCGCWSLKWADTIQHEYCSHCGVKMRKGGAE